MASAEFERLIGRAVSDQDFAKLLRTDVEAALVDFDLSPDEVELLKSSDPDQTRSLGAALGLDERAMRRLQTKGMGDWSVL